MKLVHSAKIVQGLAPITPSSSTPDYVSMKDAAQLTAIINVDNGSTVTASAITLKQASAVAGTGEKELAFDKMWANADTGASDTLVETAVTSNTFDTDDTDAKNLQYVIEIDAAQLDTDNGFDCVRVGTGDGANMVLDATYVMHGLRYQQETPPAAITD